MDFSFSDDQLLFRDAVRDLLAAECPPEAVRAVWDGTPAAVPPLWAKLAEMGVVGLTAPEDAGGLGMDEVDLVLLLEESGRAAYPGPLVETTAVGIPLLAEAGAGGGEWLRKAAAGDAVLAVGLSGPYVAFAAEADVLLLRHGDELHAVDPAAAGVEPVESVDGARRLARVRWEPGPSSAVAVDAAGVLDAAFDRGALGAAAQLAGLAGHLVDVAVEYAKARHQFGVPIGSYQAVKHHLANVLLELEHARPLVYRAAYSIAHDDPDRGLHVSLAKAYASRAADRAARVALQVHGAIGYTMEYDLHLWMKRAWALGRAWGDEAWHRRRIAAAVL